MPNKRQLALFYPRFSLFSIMNIYYFNHFSLFLVFYWRMTALRHCPGSCRSSAWVSHSILVSPSSGAPPSRLSRLSRSAGLTSRCHGALGWPPGVTRQILSVTTQNTSEPVLMRCLNPEPITEWGKSERGRQTLHINAYIWSPGRWYWWTCLQGSSGDAVRTRTVDTVGEREGGVN